MSLHDRLRRLTETAIIKPTIHMNGTSKDALLKDLLEVLEALRKAQDALQKAGPNGRDYYPQGDHALRQAQAEHRERMVKLNQIYSEIEQLAEHVSDA